MSRNRRYSQMIVTFILGSLGFQILADPPANPPPCDVVLEPLFCFRVTDIQKIPGEEKFEIMMEFVNWTGQDASGIVISVNTGQSTTTNGTIPVISGASIDSDGRPFGVGSQPPAGNLPVSNDWNVVDLSPTRACFSGLTDPITHPLFDGTSGGVPATFNGLLDPRFAPPTTQAECIEALLDMIPRSEIQGGNPTPIIGVDDPEFIDDGVNVLDGFIVQIDDFDPDECISFNWHLINAAGDAIGINGTVGGVQGDEYGFGAVNLCRQGNAPPQSSFGPTVVNAPDPLFNLNTGFDPIDTSNSNHDSPLLWAEDEVDGIDSYFVNPIPAGEAGQGTYFFIEMGAAITAEFRDPADTEGFTFDGTPITPGPNVILRGAIFSDGFESGDTSHWTLTTP